MKILKIDNKRINFQYITNYKLEGKAIEIYYLNGRYDVCKYDTIQEALDEINDIDVFLNSTQTNFTEL